MGISLLLVGSGCIGSGIFHVDAFDPLSTTAMARGLTVAFDLAALALIAYFRQGLWLACSCIRIDTDSPSPCNVFAAFLPRTGVSRIDWHFPRKL